MRARWILALVAVTALVLALALGLGRTEHAASVARPEHAEAPVERVRAPELVGAGESADAVLREIGSATEASPAALDPRSGTTSVAEAAHAIVVYGFVRGDGGEALAEKASVSLVDRLGDSQRTDTSADGAYSFSGVAPGRYWLSAGSTRDGQSYAVVDLDAKRLERRVDLELERPPEVLVKVVDLTGKPLDGRTLLAVATREAPGPWFDDVQGSWNNTFSVGQFWQSGYASAELPPGYIGRVLLDVEPPVFVSLLHYQRVIETRRVEAGQEEVVFEVDARSPLLRTGSIRARFLDAETRLPLAKAYAQLGSRGIQNLATDEEGRWFISAISPGLAILRIQAEGYERLDRLIRVEPGSETDLGEIELSSGFAILGWIADENGDGVSAKIQCDAVEAPSAAIRRVGSTWFVRSHRDGSFRIPALSAGFHRLTVRPDVKGLTTATRVVDLRAGSVKGLLIELARGVPLVVRASDERWRTVEYEILDASGEVVLGGKLRSPAPHGLLLAPGRYEVEVRVGGELLPRRIPLELVDEPVELALP